MACPQCGDSVDCIGIQSGTIVHRCPVCGTQVTGSQQTNNLCIEVPQLIAQLRAFEHTLMVEGFGGLWKLWMDLGIHSILAGKGFK